MEGAIRSLKKGGDALKTLETEVSKETKGKEKRKGSDVEAKIKNREEVQKNKENISLVEEAQKEKNRKKEEQRRIAEEERQEKRRIEDEEKKRIIEKQRILAEEERQEKRRIEEEEKKRMKEEQAEKNRAIMRLMEIAEEERNRKEEEERKLKEQEIEERRRIEEEEKRRIKEEEEEEEEKERQFATMKQKLKSRFEPVKSNIVSEIAMCYNNINPSLREEEKDLLFRRMEKKRERPSLLENQTILEEQKRSLVSVENEAEIERQVKEFGKAEIARFIPNMAVKKNVEIFEPVSMSQLLDTNRIVNEELDSIKDSNAPFHLLNEIAKVNNLKFVIVNSQKEKKSVCEDLYNNPIDTALENETIAENTFHLLGSDVPEHNVKGFSLHLQGSLDEFDSDPNEKGKYADYLREKLSEIHKVPVENIIIHSFTAGSLVANYTVKDLVDIDDKIDDEMKKLIPGYLGLDIHPSFLTMRIDISFFNPSFNRDFSVYENCPKDELRGGYAYNPPEGWYRYSLNVTGKYDNGNNTWLGMNNIPGEWCVAYHGTAHQNIKSISSSALRVGGNNAYGRGIYCSPLVSVAEGYCRNPLVLKTKTQGSLSYKYVFMCRVNVSHPHHCTEKPCRFAENPNYTVHFSKDSNIWFVNLNNSNFENIRQYGILVKPGK
jgi:hypothetical protein